MGGFRFRRINFGMCTSSMLQAAVVICHVLVVVGGAPGGDTPRVADFCEAGLAVCKILGIRAKPSSPPTRARAMEPAGRKGSSEAETAEARTARLSREVAHSVEFHKERLAADFPFVKPEYLQKFALMGAVAEKKE